MATVRNCVSRTNVVTDGKDETVPIVQSKYFSDSSDSAEMLHCARVAAYAEEISRRMGFTESKQVALRQAALLHHNPEVLSIPVHQAGAGFTPINRMNSTRWVNPVTAKILAAYLHSVPIADD